MKIQGDEFVLESAVLRARGKYDEAILMIENNITSVDPDVEIVAWLMAFYAAADKGDRALAARYARKVANLDPNVPSIRDFL
jgi:hypothetical protein